MRERGEGANRINSHTFYRHCNAISMISMNGNEGLYLRVVDGARLASGAGGADGWAATCNERSG